jgi:mono/diheme cytochrome c family protein
MNIPAKFTYVIATIIFLTSCCEGKKYVQITFRESNLQTFFVEIDNTRDTIIHAPGGSLISITAGSFEGSNVSKVRLAIKEALNISDIVNAGLLTESNGKMLSSGGMIDIEAAEGKNVRIVKPLSIRLPTPFLDSKMMVFKGSKGDDEQINWTDPVPMNPNSQITTIDLGEQLFKKNCASCHSVANAVTAPALAYIPGLRPQKWLFDYTRNNQKVLKSGDPYANCLYEHYNKTPMPVFPELLVNDMTGLYTYIDNESKKEGLPLPSDQLKKCVDSCLAYKKIKDSLYSVEDKSVSRNFSVTGTYAPSPPAPPIAYYQFQVSTFGWYNIDRFCEELEGIKESRLTVKLSGALGSQVKVFLIVPRSRVFQQGSIIKNATDEYGFGFDGDELRLPQKAAASVIAVGEQGGQLVFDMFSFTTTVDQTLTLEPVHVTKEHMTAKINRLRLDSYKADTEESELEKAVKKRDLQLEKLKPKTCDCNCGFKQAPVESDSIVTGYKQLNNK